MQEVRPAAPLQAARAGCRFRRALFLTTGLPIHRLRRSGWLRCSSSWEDIKWDRWCPHRILRDLRGTLCRATTTWRRGGTRAAEASTPRRGVVDTAPSSWSRRDARSQPGQAAAHHSFPRLALGLRFDQGSMLLVAGAGRGCWGKTKGSWGEKEGSWGKPDVS